MDDALLRASEEARKSAETFRVGAAVLKGRSVVASGRNKNTNSCGLHSIHAEMDALWKTKKQQGRMMHLVVVRVLRDGRTTACSRPCPACCRALARRGIRKVTYTTGNCTNPLQSFLIS